MQQQSTADAIWYRPSGIARALRETLRPNAELAYHVVITLSFNLGISLLLSVMLGWHAFPILFIASNCIGLSCFLSASFLLNWLTPRFNQLLVTVACVPINAFFGAVVGYAAILHRYKAFSEIYIITLLVCAAASLVFYLNQRFNRSRLQVKEIENQRLNAQQQATQAELLALQNQIEPHFLFNTLANISALIDAAPEQAKSLLNHYTRFLRSSMRVSGRVQWPLADELELIKHYLAVQQKRFPNIQVDYAIQLPDAQLVQIQLPPLMLQPLVENAIRHGLTANGNRGLIQLRIEPVNQGQASFLRLSVLDDGMGLGGTPGRLQGGNGVALSNIRQRLQYAYKDRASFELSQRQPPQSGCEARILLPWPASLPHQTPAESTQAAQEQTQ